MTSRRHNTVGVGGVGRGGPAARLAAAAGSAFTLIEVLIAVGAVALIGVAIAAVFDHTGRTVTVGRRLSVMNQYASLIEQQMRSDFSRITREGFLLIHNQMADADRVQGYNAANDRVPLHPDDLSARPRRIDEIVFFIKGDFTSARDPLHPRVVARGNAARVYYGHGKRRIPDTTNAASLYMQPRLNDTMSGGTYGEPEANLGAIPPAGTINPNRYASDWALLRQQTVLCSPQSTSVFLPPSFLPPPATTWQDRDEQIALQPAASSVFRALVARFPDPGQTPAPQLNNGLRSGEGLPQFASGLVDIATTSLSEIRLVVLTADPFPGPSVALTFYDPSASSNGGNDGTNDGIDGLWRPLPPPSAGGGTTAYDEDIVARMQAWMQDALPAFSHAPAPDQRTRVRYEPQPPNFAGVLANGTLLTHAKEMQRADQVMLGASSFIPRCTEFIVEWTFGAMYPSDPAHPEYIAGREGEMIWHGMERLANGAPPQNPTAPDAVAYPYDDLDVLARIPRRYRQLGGQIAADNVPATTGNNQWVQSFLIHDFMTPVNTLAVGDPVTSYFGYVDPTFIPDKDGNGVLDATADSASATIPWAWPKLVRVTLGLADPGDPTVEQRFQFVFELPPNPEP